MANNKSRIDNPSYVATLARDIYLVKTRMDAKFIMKKHNISVPKEGVLSAETGFRLVNAKTSFGIFGTGNGHHENDIFLIFRGTEGDSHYGADIVTDIRMGVTISSTGQYVHSGFNQTFESLKPQLAEFMSKTKKNGTVYCIGHSLGGAIAQLASDWVSSTYTYRTVKVFTFGSPRVGCGIQSFPSVLTAALTPDNIYRVAHSSDPVTMVPFFPYAHAPVWGQPCYVQRSGFFLNPKAHSISQYLDSMGAHDSWGVHRASEPKFNTSSVKNWLKTESVESSSSPIFWQKLNQAAYFIFKILMSSAQVGIMAGMTVVDYMAAIIEKGLKLGEEIAPWTFYFLKKLMRLAGVPIAKTIADVTIAIVKNTLIRVIKILYREVKIAMATLKAA